MCLQIVRSEVLTAVLMKTVIVVFLHEELDTEVKIMFALNLLDIMSKFCIITIFVITDLQTLFDKQFVLILITHLHENFYIPISNGPLLITVLMKAKFHICQKSIDVHNFIALY
jgi:hypothetical protein